MAVVIGTNAGFVTVAPVADPGGDAGTCDNYSTAQKDTSPVGMTKVTEVGWWCDAATEESNFELGLYSHNAGSDKPDTRLYVENINAKGTGTGWLSVVVDWDISESTVYWIALQLDNTATASKIDQTGTGVISSSVYAGDTSLPATWNAGSTQITFIKSIYAVAGTGVSYVDISGSITGTSGLSGTLIVSNVVSISGSIAGTSTIGGVLGSELILSPNWQTGTFKNIKRLVLAANDSIWYGDI